MIVDTLDNWTTYAGVLPGLEEAFRFLDPTAQPALIQLEPGRFAVCFPFDGHMPGRHIEKPSEVHKVVFKLLFAARTGTA